MIKRRSLISAAAIFSIIIFISAIKRANDFETQYRNMKIEAENANISKLALLEAQKEAILNQHALSQRLAILDAKNAVLNKNYDKLKGTYSCERPADVEQVIMQGICDYAESTGGGCK